MYSQSLPAATTSQTNPPAVPSFKDLKGRTWHLTITNGHCRKSRELLGVDLANAHDGKLFASAQSDPLLLGGLLFLLVEGQCQQRHIGSEDFESGLDGPALLAAFEALVEAIVNFTRPSAREAVKALADKTREVDRRMAEAAANWINGEAVETTIDRMMQEAISQASEKLSIAGG